MRNIPINPAIKATGENKGSRGGFDVLRDDAEKRILFEFPTADLCTLGIMYYAGYVLGGNNRPIKITAVTRRYPRDRPGLMSWEA
jgi:hypothetical protein